jgi:methionyl-tRNA formyltransferase
MKITVATDIPNHWVLPYCEKLISNLLIQNHDAVLVTEHQNICRGDICFFLGCGQIAKPATLAKNHYNLVVHESALPAGRGWSPLTWQILEGKNQIPIALLEATNGMVDSGDIYLQDLMTFEGHELLEELRVVQGNKTIELAERFVNEYSSLAKQSQAGIPTFYSRRSKLDSELDVNMPLTQLFNQLRVADNDRYPAYFYLHGKKYILTIRKENENDHRRALLKTSVDKTEL